MERKPRRKFSKEFKNEAVRLAEESDIPAIPTREGWLYLCGFMDLYSRTIVGWSMSGRMKRELVSEALKMAVERRRPEHSVLSVRSVVNLYLSHQQGLASLSPFEPTTLPRL